MVKVNPYLEEKRSGTFTEKIAGSSSNNKAENEEISPCEPSVLQLPSLAVNYDNECSSGNRQVSEDNVIAGPSTKHRDIDQKMSFELDSDHERTADELEGFFEDSDCSVKDRDYVPDSPDVSDSETSDEELHGEPVNDDEAPTNNNTLKTPIKKRTRWKKCDPSQWKKNVSKRQKIEAKTPKPIDCSKCRFKCMDKVSEDQRLIICKNFWSCDFNRRKDFILNNVESKVPERRRAKSESRVRVCKSFFIKTLCISKEVIEHAFKNRGEGRLFRGYDKRGKKEPHNKTKSEDIQKVKTHIESFPVMQSHYTRKSTKRLYLDSKLSIAKMHSLYKEECEKDSSIPVSLITYRRILCNNYNYSFYVPKKDQCQICMQYKTCKELEKKKQLENNYQSHVLRKEDCNAAKIRDKERASKENNFMCCTFDLQGVLQLPSSDVSPMYYTRKLCTYNLTIYEMARPNNAYCYVWTETNGKRGSFEIGTCLYQYIEQLSETVTEISLFSDTCSGQNRNQNISALLLYLVQTNPNVQIIEQKFMESGHSYMEVDSMHSSIEKAKKHVPVYTIHDWMNIFRMARSSRSNKKPYHVKELKFNDFLDLDKFEKLIMKNKLKNTLGEKVNWLKVKCFKYLKSRPWILQYRYDHTSEYMEVNVLGKGRPSNFDNFVLAKAYSKPRTITSLKKADLIKLCKTEVIPVEFHNYYKSLPTSKDAQDVVPEPAAEDSDQEEEWTDEVQDA
ncbi:unnamed protein product [Ceutorhynchus assimilis]|uniref:DUF7869 domain-containing protein n=1 Tax=Ceutorhynchus assimilis TaxID=467358 RepID=A0A9N9QRQ4_9CUCU|nr:unnamed protein product [Ceutorhynchus assimilis]